MTAVAIDGPAGAGKSTIARKVAEHFGFVYVDTGALYRTVALAMMRGKISFEDEPAAAEFLKSIKVDIAYINNEQRVLLNGSDVSDEIRTPEVSMNASKCSAMPAVRAFLLGLQRELAENHDVVMDGRDIGTVVLPNAKIKIFLTATPEIRAKRRYDELVEKGEKVEFCDVLADLKQRDYNDTHRKISPLKRADDTVPADTGSLNLQESIELISNIIEKNM